MSRRVVTGHEGAKAVFVVDCAPPQVHTFKKTPGLEVTLAWTTPAQPTVGAALHEDGRASSAEGLPFLPRLGETRLLVLTIPPASIRTRPDFDAAAAAQEYAERLPEMAATREAADPGMHRTDTIDYVIVLDGEVVLELDDREEILLKQHDVVVQNGTRHAWRNRGERLVTLAVVLVGARRE